MDRSERAIITVMCMIYNGNKLLLQNRRKKDWAGYTFPGGHVEKGESVTDAAVREMREETGLSVEALRICGVKQFQTDRDERYLVFLFKTDRYHGTLTSSEEGEMVWVERASLEKYPLVEDFMELLKVFDFDDINEFVYQTQGGGDWKPELH